ncbi:MAG: RNA polymerase sigma factor [Planctomycetota bacterium]
MIEDNELVERCLTGKESAYYDFVERFQGLVYGVCYRMLGDPHEAEDVAQEVFVRAVRNLSRWDPSRPLRPWLLTIAANRCRTHMSRLSRRPSASEFTNDIPDHRDNEDQASELKSEIQAALTTLRPEYRQVFLLFHEQGLGYEEMSQLTGRPVGTLKTWLHRARGELMSHLRRKGLAPEVRHDLSGV